MDLNKEINAALFRQACVFLPLGVFFIDANKKIIFWNKWLEIKTGVSEKQIVGKQLDHVFPEINNPRFDWAIEQVIFYKSPQVLSQILNHHLIPIKLKKNEANYMPQHIELLPIGDDKNNLAMVIISDMTEMVAQKQALLMKASALEQDSYHDVLTSSYNRRYMWSWLEKEFAKAVEEESTISCILLDLDHFKPINDSYGHEVGDKVLKEFRCLCQSYLRASDIFVRYGGEEFVILLSKCSLKNSFLIANKINKGLACASIAGLPQGRVTCSSGLACWNYQNPISAKRLVSEADKAMYVAKSLGRNQAYPDLS
jgi:diguanylate cyclase (GGDEF)-like protein